MTDVKIRAGGSTIGGTFIQINDRDTRFVFDQGIRFDILKRFYSGFDTPLGVMELRKLGVVPQEAWYDGVEHVYITHLHLDHLGALSNLPKPVHVHIPGNTIYREIVKKRWEKSPSWLQLIPEPYYVKTEDATPFKEDENGVLPLPVSHSAFPAVSYLFFGENKTVLYTGDLRVSGYGSRKSFSELRNGPSLLDYAADRRDLRIDTLIVEGTNFGSDRLPMSPQDSLQILARILKNYDHTIITAHNLDVEFLTATIRLAQDLGIACFTLSEPIAKTLESIGFGKGLTPVEGFTMNKGEAATLQDAFAMPSVLLTSYFEILQVCKKMSNIRLKRKTVAGVITQPEPRSEEMTEYDTLSNWLILSGVHAYRLRVSGHYYPFEMRQIAAIVRPKTLVPVHTKNPRMVREFFAKIFA